MLISPKQQDANLRNAAHSTGPQTPGGKAAVRLNALTYGLRARSLLIPGENPADYQQLWADLETDWQPHGRTERLCLEQMATSQWLLARMATAECRIYQQEIAAEKQLALLDRVSMQRARLERSFASAMRALERLQQKRKANRTQPAQSPPAQIPRPPYLMAEPAAAHPACGSPITPDSR